MPPRARKRAIARYVILAGGGHAKVLIDCLRASRQAEPTAILDANPALWGQKLLGISVKGGDGVLSTLRRQGVEYFIVGLGGVGDNNPRRKLFEKALAAGLRPLTVRHPSAVCSPEAEIGEGSVLFPQCVVNAYARLGKNVIVNSGAIVEHDCQIGDHVHVASAACLASTVRVGCGAHIGAGAVVRQGLSIGDEAVVGAGAVVVKNVLSREVVVGVPARPLETLAGVAALARGFER